MTCVHTAGNIVSGYREIRYVKVMEHIECPYNTAVCLQCITAGFKLPVICTTGQSET